MTRESLDHFIENQDHYVNLYNGKFLVFVGKELVGVYDTFGDACRKPQEKYEAGTYHVQKCIAGKEAYTIKYSGLPVDEKQRMNEIMKSKEFQEQIKKILPEFFKNH